MLGLAAMPPRVAGAGQAAFPHGGEGQEGCVQTYPAGLGSGTAATGIPQGFLSFHCPKKAMPVRYAQESPLTLH